MENVKKRPRAKARLMEGKCISCGALCETACPVDAITMDGSGRPVISEDGCIGCWKCAKVCPASAIEMKGGPEGAVLKAAAPAVEAGATAGYKGVWVFVEHARGQASKVSWELMGAGKRLSESLKEELSAVVIGHSVEGLCHEAFGYGAARAYLVDEPVMRDYTTEPYLEAAASLVRKFRPEIILMGGTPWGKDLAGALAARLETGLTADCVELSIDETGNLLQTRPAFSGNIMATIVCPRSRPQMATVRPHVMPMPAKSGARKGVIVRHASGFDAGQAKKRVIEPSRAGREQTGIETAEVIVAGGMGVGGRENFRLLDELARELGGVVAATKGPADEGWVPKEMIIGTSGRIARPRLYIACGISGAAHHMSGIRGSGVIIAINKDADAPIFQTATYGIVGDLMEVLPALTERIREIKRMAA